MTPGQKLWFDALTKDRADSAAMLEKPSMRGVQRSVVDKYSDQAHFIYELLQNADDAKATSARFVLKQDGLVFTHNGTTRFSISNPATEADDSENGTMGHINAITSIANSNKTESSIGKFGVGFKAVFQYTKTPHIYDPDCRFRIERFIVPRELDADFKGRKAHETVFLFPFDHEQKQPDDCRSEVAEKLKALVFPTLFLSNLASVSWEMDGETGKYSKAVKRTLTPDGLTARLISLVSEIGAETSKQDLWLFSRPTENGLPYCIGYAVAKGKLEPIFQPAFCFFPTKETTNLNFIVHAPFLLTDSREGIKAGEKHNQEMVQKLARLAADSLPVLRDQKLIDDGIVDIIPYDEARFSERPISFKPFYTDVKVKLQTDTLLPAAKGEYSSKDNAYWASDTELVGLFGDEQLTQLTGTKDARWVFRGFGKKEVQNARKHALADYIDGGDARIHKRPSLIVSSLDPEGILKRISADFISAQTQTWLHRFYAYLAERASYQNVVKDRPIFLDEYGNAVSAYDSNNQLILFLPDNDIDGYATIKKDLLSVRGTREFIVKFGIKKPSLRDEIYNKIIPGYKTNDGIDTTPHFKKFFHYFKECRHDEIDEFVRLISELAFLKYKTASGETAYRGKGNDIYLPTDGLKAWFEPKPDTKFLLLDEYHEMANETEWARLDEFLRRLGVSDIPRVVERNRDWTNEDKTIDGLNELLSKVDSRHSIILWNMLAGSRWHCYSESMKVWRARYGPRGGLKGHDHCDTSASIALRTKAWILNQSGELVSAKGVTVQSLSDKYNTTSSDAMAFIRFLGICDELSETTHLSEDEKRKIRLAEKIEQSGLSEEELLAAIEEARRKNDVQVPSGKGDNSDSTVPSTDRSVFHDIRQRMDARNDKSGESGTGQEASSRPHNGTRRKAMPQAESDVYSSQFLGISR